FTELVLAVNTENEAGQALYEKCGFMDTLQCSRGRTGTVNIMRKVVQQQKCWYDDLSFCYTLRKVLKTWRIAMNIERILHRMLRLGLYGKAMKNGHLPKRIGRRLVRKTIRNSTRKRFK